MGCPNVAPDKAALKPLNRKLKLAKPLFEQIRKQRDQERLRQEQEQRRQKIHRKEEAERARKAELLGVPCAVGSGGSAGWAKQERGGPGGERPESANKRQRTLQR